VKSSVLKNCILCNKEFITKPSHFSKRKFCSRDCHNKERQVFEIRNCVICNALFKFYNSTLKFGAIGKYCSLQCKGKGLTLIRPIKKCENCNSEFTTSLSYKMKKYCSKKCYSLTMEGIEKPSFWETASEENKLERLRQSFEKYIIRNKEGCWGWKGSLKKKYGSLQYGGKYKSISAHRASWILNFGPIPEGMFVCHNCPGGDNPNCFNPNHLFLGTPTDNVHDMHKKGRANILKGQEAPGSKLTEFQIMEIKKLLKQNITLQDIADKFNVHIFTISDIKNNRTWKHIKD